MWYEKFGFEEDPYRGTLNPFKIPLERFEWNRDDLTDKKQLFEFIDRVTQGYRVGLKVFGAIGGGKTWLLRIIQKFLLDRNKDILVIYTSVPRSEPWFSTIYEQFVKSLMPELRTILEYINQKAGPNLENWKQFIKDDDLATCLYDLLRERDSERNFLNRQWLLGQTIGLRDRRTLNIISTLEADYRKVEVMKALLNLAADVFPTCVLIIDEMHNVPSVSSARALGESLRGLIDGFYEKFALVCSYTAVSADELIDFGYGEYLYRRLEYSVRLDALNERHVPKLFRAHHKCYRKEGFKVDDQLYPFDESGITKLIDLLDAEKRYPGYVLTCCGTLASEAFKRDVKIIDEDFVESRKRLFPQEYLAKT
jgi:hypothetical protein